MGMFDLISQSLDTRQNTIARLQLAGYSPDIIINNPKNACHFHASHPADEIIALARQRAEASLTC